MGRRQLVFGGLLVTIKLLLVGAERRISGGEVFLHHLALGLAERPGFSVDVLAPKGAEVVERIRSDPRSDLVRLFTTEKVVRLSEAGPVRYAAALFTAGREILSMVRREGYDIVVFNGVGTSAYGLVLRLLGRCRQIAIHHNIASSRAERAFGRWLFAGNSLVCVSQAVATAVASPLNRRRLRLILNGVPLGAAPRPESLSGPGPLRVLSAGRITEWKGIHVLIEALDRMKARAAPGPLPVEVEIAGRPWSREEVEYEAGLHRSVEEKGLSDWVRFVGHVPLDPKWDWAHCLVHTSVDPEPFGMVVAEAMSRGCLVIASDGGGVREYVRNRETGYLVAHADASGLADLLEWLARHRADPEVAAVRLAAWKVIEAKHSLDRQVGEYVRLLREIAGEPQ
jgi:glycosyltransferase involved in cell wall biosynthesis